MKLKEFDVTKVCVVYMHGRFVKMLKIVMDVCIVHRNRNASMEIFDFSCADIK